MTAARLPPGPPARFFTGHLHDLRRDLLALYTRCAREYGPVAMLRFGFRRVWVISEPDLIEQILTSRNFTKHYALRMNRMLLGDGLLTSEGDFWLRQRRLIPGLRADHEHPLINPLRLVSHATALSRDRMSFATYQVAPRREKFKVGPLLRKGQRHQRFLHFRCLIFRASVSLR